MDVVVSGASGLIGTALVAALEARGDRVRRLVRPGQPGGPGTVAWDPTGATIDRAGLAGVDAAVHLAGVGIAEHRWTDAHKQAIRASRVQGTTLLAEALAGLDPAPQVLVSASAVGYYGDRGDEVLTEASSAGTGFLAEVVQAWEEATAPAADAGIRVALARNGIVLSASGGVLGRLLPVFKFGLGGPIGGGEQWVAWISLDDEVRALLHLLDGDLAGPVDLTAPTPVTNRELAAGLGHVLHRPAFWPIPSFGPALLFGRELVDQLVMASQRVVPARLEADGFTFEHPTLDDALHDLLGADHQH